MERRGFLRSLVAGIVAPKCIDFTKDDHDVILKEHKPTERKEEVVLGSDALSCNTSNSYNIGIGYKAGYRNSS